MSIAPSTEESQNQPKVVRYLGILAIGLLLCINGAPFLFYYPAGIGMGLSRILGIQISNETSWPVGFIVYGLLFGVIMFCPRKNERWLTGIMIIITLINVIGCQSYLTEFSKIGK